MASPPATDLYSSAAYEDDTPAPPGWRRKLVPRVGRGLTPTKTDVVYISPDGEEIKSKAQLQRYLKTHTDGPAVSEFNWSSGETPRRSARFSSKPHPETMEVDVKPKNVKRKSSEIPQEESNAEQVISSPRPKQIKKGGKNVAVESKGLPSADTALASIAAEEAVKDARKEEDDLLNSEAATKPVAANGDAQESKKDENLEAHMENSEALETVNNENLDQSVDGEDLEPSGLNSTSSEKKDEISEPVSDEIVMEKEDTMSINAKDGGKSLELPNICAKEGCANVESQEIKAESSPRKDEHEAVLSEANHHKEIANVEGTVHEEIANVDGTVHDDEKGLEEDNNFAEEAEVVN